MSSILNSTLNAFCNTLGNKLALKMIPKSAKNIIGHSPISKLHVYIINVYTLVMFN